ncbi:hypothetical protein C8Q70DRAFT_1120356 [Cubamyces menziesii]|nr:hypothetical protein C8Q70DRAFT_1120356 [Cubamyces menziesii]
MQSTFRWNGEKMSTTHLQRRFDDSLVRHTEHRDELSTKLGRSNAAAQPVDGPSPYDCYSGGTPRWSIARCKSTKYACSKTSVRHALRRHQDDKIWQQALTPVVGRKRQIRNNLRGRKTKTMKINAARPYQCMINGAVPHKKVSPWIGGDALLVRGPLLVGSRVKHDSRVDAKKGPTEGSQGSLTCAILRCGSTESFALGLICMGSMILQQRPRIGVQ